MNTKYGVFVMMPVVVLMTENTTVSPLARPWLLRVTVSAPVWNVTAAEPPTVYVKSAVVAEG